MIIKLIPGQRIALTVAKTEEVEGNYGPQIKFSGSTPDDHDAAIFLNVETAQQQLSRINLGVESVIGHTVEIERVEKNGRKFTNINRLDSVAATAGNKASTAKQAFAAGGPLPWEQEETGAPPVAAPAKADTGKLDRMFALYDVCLDHAHAVAKKKFGADVTDEAVAAMTATLYIQANQKGLGT